MVGQAVERHPELAKEFVDRGHEASGHGQTRLAPEREFGFEKSAVLLASKLARGSSKAVTLSKKARNVSSRNLPKSSPEGLFLGRSKAGSLRRARFLGDKSYARMYCHCC